MLPPKAPQFSSGPRLMERFNMIDQVQNIE